MTGAGLADLQDAMLRALFAESPAEGDLALLGEERARVLLYRDLARSRIVELLEAAMPRTTAALGAAARPAISAWMARRAPPSRFFRDLPILFSDHLLADLHDGPPWLADLVRLERARWHAMIAEEDGAPVVTFDLEKVPAPSATLTVLAPEWSVHRDGETPVAGRAFVCVYRRPDHVVETRWNERLPGLLVEGWARGAAPAIETVRSVLASEGVAADHGFVERMSELLTVLLERGALRGSRP